MVAGRFRSRTFRRIKKKLPGNRVALRYEKRAHSKAHCGSCGAVLPAVRTGKATELRNLPKTAKRPERPYGGVLCSRCMREKIRSAVMQEQLQ